MHYLKSLVVSCIAVALLNACGGGGANSTVPGPASLNLTPPPSFAGRTTSTLDFPLSAALQTETKEGSSVSYSVSGTCAGTATAISSKPTSATFGNAAAFAVSNNSTMQFSSNNCQLLPFSAYWTDYFDSNYLPLGTYSSSTGEYGVFASAPVIPVSVKVGDVGTIGTKNYYADSSMSVSIGYDMLSYVIEPDTANTAIVNLITESFTPQGVLFYAEQNRYKIWSNGALVSVSSDVQEQQAHLILTAVPDTTPPQVISSVTQYQNTSIPVDIQFSATFSEWIDPATIDASTITLSLASGGAVPGTITYSGKTVTFVPSSYLMPGTSYVFTIGTGVKDLAGNSLAQSFIYSFVTEPPYGSPPAVGVTAPANGAHMVPLDTSLVANFNTNKLNPATITNSAFYVTDGVTPVSGTLTYNFVFPATNTITFKPDSPLQPNTIYTATITSAIQDIQGNFLPSNYSWSFVTDLPLLNDPVFVLPAKGSAFSVQIGDVTGDGRNDLVYAGGVGLGGCDMEVLSQDTNGGLGAPVSYALAGGICWPSGLAIGDVNHDGKNDVVVGNGSAGLLVYTQTSNGTLNSAVVYASSDTKRVSIADVNHDGLMDVIGAGAGISVWLQNANGTLNAPVQISLNGLAAADLDVGDVNNDGLSDIVVSVYDPNAALNSAMLVITQQPGGTLSAPVSYDLGRIGPTKGLVIGDIDSDRFNEVVYAYAYTANGSGIGVFHQNAAGTLNSPVTYPSFANLTSLSLADISGDGRLDVVGIASYTDFKIVGYTQLPNGTLQSVRQYSTTNTQINPSFGPFAVGDINGDGKLDVVVPDIFSNYLPVYYHK